MQTHIVLLGGGYVSVWAYRSLFSRLRGAINRGQVLITVVCPEEHHVFHGWTAEALTGLIAFENRLSPLRKIMPKARHINGVALAVNAQQQQVQVQEANGKTTLLEYDHLLMGIGSFDNCAVDGVQQFGHRVKGLQDLRHAMNTLHNLVEQAARQPHLAPQLLRFAVAGAGFTGVEMAANLAEYLQVLIREHISLLGTKPTISLIYSTKHILPELEGSFQRMHKYARKQLVRYGIELVSEARLAKVDQQGAWLVNGAFIPASMVFSTIGQARLVLPGTEPWLRDAAGRVKLNTWLQVPHNPRIWGGGDACHVRHCISKQPCPSNALWAIKHGHYAGINIARTVLGKVPRPFTYRGLGQAASLGLGKGITELYGLQFTGLIAWIMRWFFFNYFMPSKTTMWYSIGNWCRAWFTGKRLPLSKASRPAQAAPAANSHAGSALPTPAYAG
ncbi:MAG TPA: FAD-dependent oxidoreductase [Phnomibacter sp.]|nr:FAD-dependent oxidoreductase [Phnomibacter sp.]